MIFVLTYPRISRGQTQEQWYLLWLLLSKQPPEKLPSRQDVIKIPSRLLPLIDTRTLFWSNLEKSDHAQTRIPEGTRIRFKRFACFKQRSATKPRLSKPDIHIEFRLNELTQNFEHPPLGVRIIALHLGVAGRFQPTTPPQNLHV